MTSFLKRHPSGCPHLILAPMEGVADRPFRKALSLIGGFDEACTEFIRVPINAHVESLAKVYDANEISPIPLVAQVMGSDPVLVAKMGQELEKKGAHRIDLNCGCPSNTVTGRGAGSSLLKDPLFLYEVAKSLKDALNVPVSVKMRIGFQDTSLFDDNLKAIVDAGIDLLTIHPRTKVQGYSGKADWSFIQKAKKTTSLPIIGNGDLTSLDCALKMLQQTDCDALMIGRGAVMDPFIFQKIKAHFENKPFIFDFSKMEFFLKSYLDFLHKDTSSKMKINKLKQILNFIFKSSTSLESYRKNMLTFIGNDPVEMLEFSLDLMKKALCL